MNMLGAAQPNALGTERARAARGLGRVGVRAHTERAQLVAPAQDGLEVRVDLGRHERHVAGGDGAGAAVDGDQVALVEQEVADPDLAGVEIHVDRCRAGDGGPAHAASDERGVRGLAALGGQDALGGVEAGHVVRLGEWTHEDDGRALGGSGHVRRRGEDDVALGSAGRGGDAAGDDLELRGRVEGRVQQRVQPLGVDRGDRLGARQQALLDGVGGEADGRLRGALGVARLQHVQAPLLDRELRVLHVAVVALERPQDLQQVGVDLGPPALQLAEVERRARPGAPQSSGIPLIRR
jgi:hypothetical protein